jgi:hypothetical protein
VLHIRCYQSGAFAAAVAAGLLFAAGGCGRSQGGPQTYRVSGNVTLDGTPVESGRILFRKTDGDRRPFAADITNGRYELQTEAGKMAVEITASRLIPGKFDNSNDTPEPVGEMYIPERYNKKTTLGAEVTSSGSNEFPFELSSKKK